MSRATVRVRNCQRLLVCGPVDLWFS